MTRPARVVDTPASSRSYVRTQKLDALYASEPERAAEIEAFCFGLLAARGPLEVLQCVGIVNRLNALLAPWVVQVGANATGQARRTDDVMSEARAARRAALARKTCEA